ncbi:MAG: site-specific DNA-methyltransferase [Patescibacteria group bacterium]|nr:site-specific DNA-methyltransferase [Patescibacteria group bacterium]
MSKQNEDTNLNKIPATSPDTRKDILEKIREIYPALFGEDNALNVKELQSLVDDYSKPEAERYSFPWAGKTASKRFAFTPSKARLVPDKERSVDFDTTQNLIIEGENLEVLKLLQASYFKKVKMIYIDPPYNTGHDFVYPDDYSESKQAYWEKNGVYHDGVRMDTNTESSGRYHSNWLSMMQSRLLLARNLLRDDGVIFVSIDDNEVHNLRKLMDEIFGEENFVGCAARVAKKSNNKGDFWAPNFDYILTYTKFRAEAAPFFGGVNYEAYDQIETDGPRKGEKYQLVRLYMSTIENRNPEQRFFIDCPDGTKVIPPGSTFPPERPILGDGIWRWTRNKFDAERDRIVIKKVRSSNLIDEQGQPAGWNVFTKTYLNDVINDASAKPNSLVEDYINQIGSHELNDLEIPFDYPKPFALIKYLMEISRIPEDSLVLDFFAGSGSTGHAVMELNKEIGGNRAFILVQLPEATDEKSEAFKAGYKTISQITIERVKRAGVKIKLEKPEVDVGFKALRLTKSLFPQNLFEVDPDMTEEQKVKAWEIYLENSKQAHFFDYKPDELLVEIALKDGFDLNFKAEPIKDFKKNKVLDVSDGEKTALVCLDATIEEETINALDAFKERRFICLERSVDSTRKWNLKRMFGENLWVA